ncbi:hypothetical protein V1281_006774 [Nitrobacteraceae bacterium AZCC 2161]
MSQAARAYSTSAPARGPLPYTTVNPGRYLEPSPAEADGDRLPGYTGANPFPREGVVMSAIRTAISRRGVIAALAVGAAANLPAIAATAAGAPLAAGDDPLDALWRERNGLVAKSHQLAAERAAAAATMPEWARPGPAYVDSAGRACGETVPWPRRLDATLPGAGGRRLARPSRQLIEDAYQHDRRADPAAAEHFRARRLAAFEDRLVAQRLEEDRAGVTRVQHEIEADWLDDRFHESGIEKPASMEPEVCWWIPRLRRTERGATSWQHGGRRLRW